MKIILNFFERIWREFVIIFLFIFLLNVVIGKSESTINADGIGYYDYLPSLFIHHDLNRKDISIKENGEFYKRIDMAGIYVPYENKKVNKYPCGTAILELPFFTYSYLTTDLENNSFDGYQRPFQKSIFHAAIFYLFLSLIFIRKTLQFYEISSNLITFIQLLIVFATTVTHYANVDAGFSHIYSFFAINAFIFFTKSYFQNTNFKHFLFACVFLGIIILLRQINVLIIFFIPFIAGSISVLKKNVVAIFQKKSILILGILIIFSLFSIQCLLWYFQVGKFLIYSYQGEGFNFLDPQIMNVLFSYRKGLFVYTPILLISLISIIWLLCKHQYYLAFTWVLFFSILTYVLSSWSSWEYGCSYGLRAYIDYYFVFFIPLAIMLNKKWNIWRIIICFLTILTIPINIIQTYQYKSYILHWYRMDKVKYWKVFLKTDPIYVGMIWKKEYTANTSNTLKEFTLANFEVKRNATFPLFSIESKKIPEMETARIIQISFDNDFNENESAKFNISIKDSVNNYQHFWAEPYLIHFADKELNKWQIGINSFEFEPITDGRNMSINVVLMAGKNNVKLKNVKIKFLK